MISQDTTDGSDGIGRKRKLLLVVAISVLVGGLVAGLVVAETSDHWEDDFEDGNTDGWETTEDDVDPRIEEESYHGTYSLAIADTDFSDSGMVTYWDDGPTLNTEEDTLLEGTAKPSGSTTTHVRINIGLWTGEDAASGARIVFDDETNTACLTDETNCDDVPDQQRTSYDFHGEWLHFKIDISEDEEEVRGKIWEAGTIEPAEWQMVNSFQESEGHFVIRVGSSADHGRELLLDEITIEGEEERDPDLALDAPSLMHHGDTYNYSVTWTEFDEQEGQNVTIDVTDEAEVESMDESGIEVDQEETLLIATDDEEFNDVVELRVEYDGAVNYEEVAVAKVEVENLEILPGIWRFAALMGDTTIQVILITIGAGVVAARASTSFGGLAAMQLALTIGWFGGWIPTGIALVGLFAALFIGFNLAANVDYAVR